MVRSRYIYFDTIEPEVVTQERFYSIVEKLEKYGYKEMTPEEHRRPGYKTRRSIYREYYYIFRFRDNIHELRYNDPTTWEDCRIWCDLTDGQDQNNVEKMDSPASGALCVRIMNKFFKERNGVTTRKAFGYCDRDIMRRCCPKQFFYVADHCCRKTLKNVCKDDVSSHYGAALCGVLPTWNDRKECDGMVEPSEEYPFAFYPESGHICIYGELDTRKYINSDFGHCLFKREMIESAYSYGEAEKTILCKASEYRYDDIVCKIYEDKNKGEFYETKFYNRYIKIRPKDVLNKYIGSCHLRDMYDEDTGEVKKDVRNRLDHVAAVCIARANEKMIRYIDQIGGIERIYQVVTDSVIYHAGNSLGGRDKKLGAFITEVEGMNFIMLKQSQYVFFDDDGNAFYWKHQGLEEKNIKMDKPEDIYTWER